MTFAGLRLSELSESRAYKDLLPIGEQREAAALLLRQLKRRYGGITEAQQTTLRQLPTEQLESLAAALLAFQTPDDLAEWLKNHQPS